METLYHASHIFISNRLMQGFQRTNWTKEDNRKFESCLALFDRETPDRWLKVASMIPGKSVLDVIEHYKKLKDAISDIEAGLIPFPGNLQDDSSTKKLAKNLELNEFGKRPFVCRSSDHEKKKGLPWTEENTGDNEEDMNLESLSKHFGRPLDDAAKSFGVSRSTFKRKCRELGIKRWQSGKRRMRSDIPFKLGEGLKNISCSGLAPVHDTVVAHTSQDLSKMTVKATYVGVTIRFELPDLSGIAELEENVIERLHLERESFSIKYQDDEGDWVLIACDKDVRECVEFSRSLKKTTIKMLIDLPINPCAV